jgi:hypothetical protein
MLPFIFRPRGSVRAATVFLLLAASALGCRPSADVPEGPDGGREGPDGGNEGWVELFNGRDLTGWIPKIRGEPPGMDARRTFRVQSGVLVVSYDGYDADAGFGEAFGHLFHETPLDAYELVVEYRFVGEQFTGGPDWARSNSGVMFHAQAPETMGLDQDFPVSLEVQFLGGAPGEVRPTANLCTPGTHVSVAGEQVTRHCIEANAPTLPDSTWVSVRLVAHGDGTVIHMVGTDTVLSYGDAVVGGGEANGTTPEAPPDGTPLRGGYIALQSESHPIEFRRVALRTLGGG